MISNITILILIIIPSLEAAAVESLPKVGCQARVHEVDEPEAERGPTCIYVYIYIYMYLYIYLFVVDLCI